MKMRIEPNTPLSTKVARRLRTLLRTDFTQGGRIPGEVELAGEFGVSRGTVRQALAILEREGAIFRRQGSGTYANQYVLRIAARAETAYEFSELIKRTGFDAGLEVIGLERRPAEENEADALGINFCDPLIVVKKLFFAEDAPAVYCIDKLPVALIVESFEETELARPIFDFIEQRCHTRVDYMLAEIIPRAAEGEIAECLQLQAGAPALELVERSYSDNNEPILLSQVFYSDALIRFTVLRKKA